MPEDVGAKDVAQSSGVFFHRRQIVWDLWSREIADAAELEFGIRHGVAKLAQIDLFGLQVDLGDQGRLLVDLVVLPGAEYVIFQLGNGVMAFRLIPCSDDEAERMRVWSCEEKFVNQSTTYGISEATTFVSRPYMSMARNADPLAPVTRI
ncbi:MAG: hypothetical protein Q9223_007372 [Gallowayella weberi]